MASARVKDGFYKEYGVLNNQYVLLAAGGHQKFGNSAGDIPHSNGVVNTELNADMTDGLHVHEGRNNEPNKIVRTDDNGHIQTDQINLTSTDMGQAPITKIYVSDNGYIKYKTPSNFFEEFAMINQGTDNYLSIIVGSQERHALPNFLGVYNGLVYGNNGFQYFNLDGIQGNVATSNTTPTSAWYHIMRMNHGNQSGYYADIAVPLNDVAGVYWRQIRGGNSYGWYKFIDSNNYVDYLGYIATTPVQPSSQPQDVTGILSLTFDGATSAGINYITGTGGKILFGNTFQIDSLGNNAIYLNQNSDNDVYIAAGTNKGKVGIGTTSPEYPLHVLGDSYTTKLMRAGDGFYVHDNGVYYTSKSKAAEIDVTQSNEMLISSNESNIYINKQAVSRGTLVLKYYWHAGTSTNWAEHELGILRALIIYSNKASSSTSGGISLYGDSDPIQYGIAFRGVNTYGSHGLVLSDWATYFSVHSDLGTGWIFRCGNNNYASIAKTGEAYFTGIGQDHYIVYPNGGKSVNNSGTVTGAIAISLPVDVFKSSTMMKMTVEIYNYSDNTSSTYIISGYNYSDGNWYSCTAYSLGSSNNAKANLKVRFGDNGSRNVIWIGETDTTWSYPQVYIKDITLGHSNSEFYKWATGWSINFVSTFGNVKTTKENPATGTGYWANQPIQANSLTTTTPQFGRVDINGSNSAYQLYVNGTSYLNGNLDVNGVVTGIRFVSNVATGTPPYSTSSTTLNTNLNADLLDGYHANGLFEEFSNAGSQTTRIKIGNTTRDLNIDADKLDGFDATGLFQTFENAGSQTTRIKIGNTQRDLKIDADMTDGLHVHSGRNNEANKIVRTDANGYIQAGWINTTSGDMGTGAFNKIYVSNDDYIRYVTQEHFVQGLNAYWANLHVQTTASNTEVPSFGAIRMNGVASAGTNYITGTAGRIFFGGNFHIDSLGSNSTYINHYTSNNVYMVTGGGKVGINIADPQTKLDIRGNDKISMSMDEANEYRFSPSFKGTVHLAHASHGSGTGLNDGYIDGITFGVGNASYAGIFIQNSGAYGSKMIFTTTNDYSYNKARMIINHVGNVGINTMSPDHKLSIYGNYGISIYGNFNYHPLYQDGNWRPGLSISGNYPYIWLTGGSAGNTSHGATITLAATDSGSSGSFKAWTFGVNGQNATWIDLGYGSHQNPHYHGQNGTTSGWSGRVMRWTPDQTTIWGTGNDCAPTLLINSSRNGSWTYGGGFMAPNLSGGNNIYIPVGQSMSTRNCIGLTHYHYGSGSTSNYAAMEIWGVGNIQRWYYGDMRTWFAGRVDGVGFYHTSYGSPYYFLTSDGGARYWPDLYDNRYYRQYSTTNLNPNYGNGDLWCGYGTGMSTQHGIETGGWYHIFSSGWSDNSSWMSQIAIPTVDYWDSASMWYRTIHGSNYAWRRVLDQRNYRASFGTTGGTSYIKININSTSAWMLSFKVRVYQSYTQYDLIFSGYNYGGNYWYSPQVRMSSGTTGAVTCYFGYDSPWNLWVGIPGGSYTGIEILECSNGYVQTGKVPGDLFTISNVSSLGNVQSTQTAYQPWSLQNPGYADNRYLRKDTNDSTPYQYTFSKTNDHAIQIGTIRGYGVGSCTGNYLHIYERVHIGSPSGWGSRNAPSYGLSTYGGAWLATDTGNVGIGCQDPGYKLDVRGTGRFTQRLYPNEWIQFSGYQGLYWPDANAAAHIYPNNATSYAAILIRGTRGGYNGIVLGTDTNYIHLMDNANDKGLYQQSNGVWVYYYYRPSNKVGILTSSLDAQQTTIQGDVFIRYNTLDNTAFRNNLMIFGNNSNESSGESFTESYASWGIGFRRQWSSGTATGACAGIYCVPSGGWRAGLAFRVKNNQNASGATHDVTAVFISPKGALLQQCYNSWLSPARVQIGRLDSGSYSDRACVGATDGNLHIDPYSGHGLYLNYYCNGTIYLNGGTYNISSDGQRYNGSAAHLLINGVTWMSNWYWSGQSGQPSWLWGSNDGVNMYVWNPSNFRVSYANSSDVANKLAIYGYGNSCFTYYQTSGAFDGNSGWCHYLIANHGDGASYYHYTIGLPFWGVPIYRRQTGSTSSVTRWFQFITEENIANFAMDALPVGTILMWGNTSLPSGKWRWYTEMNNRFPKGVEDHSNGSYTSGRQASSHTRNITVAQLPSHQHYMYWYHSHSTTGAGGSFSDNTNANGFTDYRGNGFTDNTNANGFTDYRGNSNTDSAGSHQHFVYWYHSHSTNAVGGSFSDYTNANGFTDYRGNSYTDNGGNHRHYVGWNHSHTANGSGGHNHWTYVNTYHWHYTFHQHALQILLPTTQYYPGAIWASTPGGTAYTYFNGKGCNSHRWVHETEGWYSSECSYADGFTFYVGFFTDFAGGNNKWLSEAGGDHSHSISAVGGGFSDYDGTHNHYMFWYHFHYVSLNHQHYVNWYHSHSTNAVGNCFADANGAHTHYMYWYHFHFVSLNHQHYVNWYHFHYVSLTHQHYVNWYHTHTTNAVGGSFTDATGSGAAIDIQPAWTYVRFIYKASM